MNDSSTGGYLAPTGAAALDDDALDAVFQQLVAGVTGIPGNLVRPLWQQNPPNLPDAGTNWVALGIPNRSTDDFAFVEHVSPPTGTPYDLYQRHEILHIRASFYGPQAAGNAMLFRDGMLIAQNRETLGLLGMGYVASQEPRQVPDLVNQQWRKRVDMTFDVKRVVQRQYPVLNLASAGVTMQTLAASPVPTFEIDPAATSDGAGLDIGYWYPDSETLSEPQSTDINITP
jgi:hypothetical protein